MRYFLVLSILLMMFSCRSSRLEQQDEPLQISGIYPHLAYYNQEGECGTGAVVPWAGRLWVMTYGPHLPYGSSDKLYEITPDLELIVRTESIGGTPANRMIHKESQQLFIGPYAIDENRNVRAIPYSDAPGRHTGMARHLTNPEEKVYLATMEEGFYEIDVNSLAINTLFTDGNVERKKRTEKSGQYSPLLPGSHGKGFYSGQGVMVYSNNGEDSPEALTDFDIKAGSLSEYDGKEWKVIRRNQFTEVTGPGGIYGNSNPAIDPVWSIGWDHKSLILAVRDSGRWSFYRLPKASHSYDGAHGWNTEWPRIRDIGTEDEPDFLMTMHGMFWHFPETFSSANSAGIRPRSAYLKVIGDFARWKGQLVFGCDDSAQKEFLNKRKAKGKIMGPGQSVSNLWFTSPDLPDLLGPTTSEGAVWLNEEVKSDVHSEPFLFTGWDEKAAWVQNSGNEDVTFVFEVDRDGNKNWSVLRKIKVPSGEASFVHFAGQEKAEWIRVKTDKTTVATVHFSFTGRDNRSRRADEIFNGLAGVDVRNTGGGFLYGLGNDRRALGILAGEISDSGFVERGYYELDANMKLVQKDDPETAVFIRENFQIPEKVISVDEASVLVIDDKGRRWRLPLGNRENDDLIRNAVTRISREVATERDLFNCHGTFYELPAENADGFAKIRPVASHNFRIHDYASYRGMLIISGLIRDVPSNNPHIIRSKDGKLTLWAGVIDDLWKLGKPAGHGGPWKNTSVKAGSPSDPYLIGFYDKKSLELSHNSDQPVIFTAEVEPIGHGPWMSYKKFKVNPGETFKYEFPEGFQSRWIRFVADRDCEATTWLIYR